jgi:hypothetical protein
VQLIAELGRRWDEEKLAEARTKLLAFDDVQLCEEITGCLASPEGSDLYVLLRVPNFFEDLALMVESGGVDEELVNRAFRDLTLGQWEYWEKAIVAMRESPRIGAGSYSQFERLATQLKERYPE